MKAAVLWGPHTPVEVLDVDLAAPREGEVLVKIAATGVCASDLHVVDGTLPEPMPLVLGHEAAGVVVETGPGVRRLRPGDHAVLSILASCGRCPRCLGGRPQLCAAAGASAARGTLADGTSRLSVNGTRLCHFNSVSSFAEYAVVPESGAVAIRPDAPLDAAALVSCAVLTGFGAVTNTAAVEPGASVAVFGCGGVGLSAIQAARVARAGEIVAVDVRPEKLALARGLGATSAVDSRGQDPVEAIRELTGGGADYAFEALGAERTVQQAWDAVAPGGTVVVVGMMPKGSRLSIDPWHFISEKTIRGCYLGSSRIGVDVPRILDLYCSGELRLEAMVSDRIRLEELSTAFNRMRAGEGARHVIVFE